MNPLWVLGVASLASMASMRTCDALLPQLAAEFAVSTGQAAHTISAFAVAYGLLQLVYGPVGDRFGRLPVVTAATLCCALGNMAIALSPDLPTTVALRAFVGGASGGIVPLSIAFIGDTVAYERRQETLARMSLATLSGMIVGQWLGGLVADAWGWRTVFWLLAAAFAAVSWPVFVMARQHGRQRLDRGMTGNAATGHFGAQFMQVLRTPWARVVLAAVTVEGAFAFSALAFVPSHLHHEFDLGLGAAGAVMALYGVGGIAFAVGARWLIPRLGEAGLVRTGGLLLGLCMAALALAPHWGWAVPACFIGGLGFYMLHSTLQTHATQMLPALRGTAISMFVVGLFGGQSVGIAAAAYVVDHSSPRWVFGAAMLVLPLLGVAFAAALQRRLSPHQC